MLNELIKPTSRIAAAVTLLLASACTSELVDASKIIAQKCAAGDVVTVEGIEQIAVASFNLAEGQQIIVGGTPLGNNNIVEVTDQGLVVKNVLGYSETIISEDGSVTVPNIISYDLPREKLRISQKPLDGLTEITVSMNCEDPTAIPPLIQPEN